MTAIAPRLLEKLTEPGTAERCGVVTKRGRVVELKNVHEEPAAGFHIEPKAFLAAIQKGAVATWHTHPGRDPNLSEEDYAGFSQWPSLTHYIVGVRDGAPAVQGFEVLDGIVVAI